MNFVDPDFPPNWKSIASCDDTSLQWRRVNSTRTSFHAPWKLNREGYNPDDIMQGSLGDCWFLSSLAVLAQYPHHIRKIILTKEMNEQGCYQVRLFENGKRRVVLLDDHFPVKHSGSLAFAQGKRNQLWVPLIEKAMAKLVGGYGYLIAGTTSEAFGALTGAPSETIDITSSDFNSEEVFDRLKRLKAAGYLLAISCGSNGVLEESFYREKGLLPEHAYSLLDVKEICDSRTNTKHRLFKLRNPWGAVAWSGEFSRYSPIWKSYPSLLEICKINKLSSAEFWINYTDLMKYFNQLTVCYFGKGWNSLPLPSVIPTMKFVPQTFYLIRTSEPGPVFFQIFQPSKRGSQNLEYKYSDVGIFVIECNPNNLSDTEQYKPIGLILNTRQQHLYVEAFLQNEKTYLLVPYRTVQENKQIPFTISIYSPVLLISKKVNTNLSNLLAPIAHVCLNGGLQVKNEKKTLLPGVSLMKYESARGKRYKNSTWIVVENATRRPVEMRLQITGAENVLVPRNSFETRDIILPGHMQILAVLVSENPKRGWCYALRSSCNWFEGAEFHFPTLQEDGLYTPLPIPNVVLPQGGDSYGIWRQIFRF